MSTRELSIDDKIARMVRLRQELNVLFGIDPDHRAIAGPLPDGLGQLWARLLRRVEPAQLPEASNEAELIHEFYLAQQARAVSDEHSKAEHIGIVEGYKVGRRDGLRRVVLDIWHATLELIVHPFVLCARVVRTVAKRISGEY